MIPGTSRRCYGTARASPIGGSSDRGPMAAAQPRSTTRPRPAKAGFANTVSVLLEHGADPSAIDDNGRTALDWLDRAAKSVDRPRVRALLRRRL
jgi:hypothetical protein